MALNPIETSLYVTFSALTHERAILPRLAKNPRAVLRALNDGHEQSEAVRKKTVMSFTEPPSDLAPYQQIIYQFSLSIEELCLTSSQPTSAIVHDILALNHPSPAMITLHETQMHYLHKIQQFLDYYNQNPEFQNSYLIPKLQKKHALVSRIFDDSKPQISGKEYDVIMDMADIVDESKNAFQQIRSIYLPK